MLSMLSVLSAILSVLSAVPCARESSEKSEREGERRERESESGTSSTSKTSRNRSYCCPPRFVATPSQVRRRDPKDPDKQGREIRSKFRAWCFQTFGGLEWLQILIALGAVPLEASE